MNIQDIANFMDLVNNPEKYNRVLKNLQDEQARLNAVIETVGKVSEIDKIRKQIDKDQLEGTQALQDKVREAEMRLELKFKVAADAQKTADETQEKAKKLLAEAQQKEASAKDLLVVADKRDRSSRQTEAVNNQLQERLNGLINEYNDKVSKLRAVMG